MTRGPLKQMMPIALEREHAGLNTPSPQVTARTVQKMASHIRASLADPLVRETAASILKACGDQWSGAGVWYWVKQHVRFVQDDELILRLFNERDHFELLISPPVLLRMSDPQGDCDDFTMLVCALCSVLKIPSRIVTVMADQNRPGEYSHVYPEAQMPNGVWCALDASHGGYPGWEVPAYDVERRTSWNLDGQVVQDVKKKEWGMAA